jgi:hypothetical protein
MQYYVYILIDPRDDVPFYVGQGKWNRKTRGHRYDDHVREAQQYLKGKKWATIRSQSLKLFYSRKPKKLQRLTKSSEETKKKRSKSMQAAWTRRKEMAICG